MGFERTSSSVHLMVVLLLACVLFRKDTHDFFGEPVSDDYAPGYSQIIKKPMDLQTMQKKIDDMAYQSITEYRVGSAACACARVCVCVCVCL